jgi:membrane associated rhomboid family serine protease
MRGTTRRFSFRPHESVIKYLIIANAVIFLMGVMAPGAGVWLTDTLELHPYYITKLQVWRLITCMFVHGNLMHVFFNMWGLYLFGAPVEQRLGPDRFLRLYFISGLVGSLAWLLANWGAESDYLLSVQNAELGKVIAEPHYKLTVSEVRELLRQPGVLGVRQVTGGVIGASGGVFGVMLACALAFPNMQIMLLFPPIPLRVRTFVLIYAGIEVFAAMGAQSRGSNIAHLAHLGGLLGAFFYMRRLGFESPYSMFKDWLRRMRWKWRRRKMHVVGDDPPPPRTPPRTLQNLEQETDRILDKIGQLGIQSLTPEERQTLEHARERLRQRGGR